VPELLVFYLAHYWIHDRSVDRTGTDGVDTNLSMLQFKRPGTGKCSRPRGLTVLYIVRNSFLLLWKHIWQYNTNLYLFYRKNTSYTKMHTRKIASNFPLVKKRSGRLEPFDSRKRQGLQAEPEYNM
jgi:hypothetical protein